MENNNKKKLQDFIVKIIRGFLWWINRIEGREPWPGYKRVYPKGYKKPEGFLQIVENKFKIFVGIRPQPYFEKINPNDNQPSCLKEYIKDSIIIYLGYKKRGDFIPAKKKPKKPLSFLDHIINEILIALGLRERGGEGEGIGDNSKNWQQDSFKLYDLLNNIVVLAKVVLLIVLIIIIVLLIIKLFMIIKKNYYKYIKIKI